MRTLEGRIIRVWHGFSILMSFRYSTLPFYHGLGLALICVGMHHQRWGNEEINLWFYMSPAEYVFMRMYKYIAAIKLGISSSNVIVIDAISSILSMADIWHQVYNVRWPTYSQADQ